MPTKWLVTYTQAAEQFEIHETGLPDQTLTPEDVWTMADAVAATRAPEWAPDPYEVSAVVRIDTVVTPIPRPE